MKYLIKKISAVTGVLFVVLALVCCKEEAKYTFKLNLEQGSVLKQKTVSDIETSTMGQKSSMNTEVEYSCEVKEVSDKGYLLGLKYESLKVSMPLMGITLDSNTEDELITLQNMSPILKVLTKNPIEIQVDKTGKVGSVNGLENISEKISEAFDPSVSEELKPQLIEQFGTLYSSESLKNLFNQTVYPEVPVKLGDKWKTEFDVTINNMSFKVSADVSLKSVENDVAALELDGTIVTAEGATQEFAGVKMTFSLKGTQKGTMKVNLKTSLAVESTLTQDVSGEVEVAGMKSEMSVLTKTQTNTTN